MFGVLFMAVNPVSAQTWTATSAPHINWASVASSEDGTKLFAAAGIDADGQIYASTNSGATWSKTTAPPEYYNSIACSSNGTHLVAAVSEEFSGVPIYTSVDSGATWTMATSPYANGFSVTSSADGMNLVAAGYYINVSTNSGTTWTQTTAPGWPDTGWASIASSADGTRLVAAGSDGIYTSTNSGTTWTQTSAPAEEWVVIASSADGTKFIGAPYNQGGAPLYLSCDSGATWSVASVPQLDWTSVASSADGTRLVAAGSGQIYTSTDSGANWTSNNAPNQVQWTSVACSADGTQLVAAVNSLATPGGIYICTITQPPIQTGSLLVAITPPAAIIAGAQWQVDSGIFQNSGATVTNLPVGTHTVSFSAISGWVTPPSQTVTVNSNQVTTTTGTYAVQEIVFHELYSFPASGTNGANPQTGLEQGTDGNFYGTTLQAGEDNYGTVFQIATNGAFTNLASFNGANGRAPYNYANLVQGSNGNFYGTTAYGGQNGNGVVFEVIPANPPTAIHSFSVTNDGANPHSGLLYASDGNMYGTTANGGAYFAKDPAGFGYGTLFKMTPSGSLGSILSFAGTNGANPWGGLALGRDGNLYGMTTSGGVGFNGSAYTGNGVIFKITTNGSLTAIYTFTNGFDGASPHAELALGNDGNFYGSAVYGGNGYGTLFRVTPAGMFTTLAAFNQTNGAYPYCRLAQGNDCNLYGTTSGAGTYNNGTIFSLTSLGELTTLHSFSGADGATPLSGLIQGNDGNFYGVTYAGGSGGVGTIFSFSPPLVFHPCTQTGQTITLTWSSVAGQLYQIQYRTNLAQANWNNLGYPLVATNGVITASDTTCSDTQRFYRVVQSQ